MERMCAAGFLVGLAPAKYLQCFAFRGIEVLGSYFDVVSALFGLIQQKHEPLFEVLINRNRLARCQVLHVANLAQTLGLYNGLSNGDRGHVRRSKME